MNMNVLEEFGVVPIDFRALVTVLGDYKYPQEKVSKMEGDGELIRLKKGLYVVSPKVIGDSFT